MADGEARPGDANGLGMNGEQLPDLSQAARTVWYQRDRRGDATTAGSELMDRDARDRDLAFYLQDAWKPTDSLTLNIGVRADFVKRYDGILGINRMDTLALGPRAGFSFMLTEDGRTVLRGNIGRVHEQMNGRDAVTSSHAGASIGSYTEYDHNGDGVPDHSVYTPPASGLDPSYLFDSDIGQPYVNEAIVGIRRQFQGQFAMDVALVHRRYNDNYEYLEQNGYWPASVPAQTPLGEFQYGRVDIEQGNVLQQTNNAWVDLVYTALEITTTRRTEKMSATLNINRQWQKYNGDWNPHDPGRFISPEKFNNTKALHMPRGNRDWSTLPSSSYSPTWRQWSVRGGFTYLLPWDITAGMSYTGNAGPGPAPWSTASRPTIRRSPSTARGRRTTARRIRCRPGSALSGRIAAISRCRLRPSTRSDSPPARSWISARRISR